MTEYAGYNATVYATDKADAGTTISSAGSEDGLFLDTCLDGTTYKTYTTSQLIKRCFDSATNVTVQKRENPPGGATWSTLILNTDYTWQPQGCIVRLTNAGDSYTQIRITAGKYFTLLQIAEATGVDRTSQRKLENVRTLGQIDDVYLATSRGHTLSLNKWWDSTISFFDYLGAKHFVMVYIDGGTANKGFCCWAMLSEQSVKTARDGVVTEALKYNVTGTMWNLY